MHLSFSILFLFFVLLFSVKLSAQTDQAEVIFIITNNGDSILTSKIFSNKTNEDQVTFLFNGQRKTYKASEIKSFFKKNRKYSIFIRSEVQHKLAQILVRGIYKLARSYSTKGEEKFYLLVNQEWKSLDPHAYNLNEYLTTVLPDIDQVIGNKKIHYNARSLGKVITEYSRLKNPAYTIIGYPGFTDKFKLGVLGSIGLNTINVQEFGSSIGFHFGLGTEISYSRLFSLKLQMVYAKNNWNDGQEILKLNTINFTPLLSLEFFRPFRNFGLSAAIGPNFLFAIEDLRLDEINDRYSITTKLNPINIGYDFQVEASLGKSIELLFSYQVNPAIKTPSGNIRIPSAKFKVNTIRAGIIYYFIH